MVEPGLEDLRAHAISHTLFPSTTLKAAIERASFIQADPIRSPAMAQDLILRHRVVGYRADDLDRQYTSLNVEEGLLYAYGFLPRPLWQLAHPPNTRLLSELEKRILDVVGKIGETHPKDLAPYFGRVRATNDWGRNSTLTRLALDSLHRRGLLRVVRRVKGLRVYAPAVHPIEPTSPKEALRRLVLAIAEVLAPAPEKSLREAVTRLRRLVPQAGIIRVLLTELIREGELHKQTVDGIAYVWPPRCAPPPPVPRVVRFLAPFDPLVWDRRRFEHLWGWSYRFEAYTPPAKRVRGYYAMPLLWADRVIGWVNARVEVGKLTVEPGYVWPQPRSSQFRAELDAEIERMERFLNLKLPN